jgi:thiol:disulfide interchange protein DsbC
MLKTITTSLLFVLSLQSVLATESDDLTNAIEAKLPGIEIESISELPDTGLYEAVANGQIIYFTKDLDYLIQGEVTELSTRENLTEQKRISLRQAALASINEKDLIIYQPEKPKYTITVFTDIDCGYCRKLHQEMAKYNELGIRVRYMAFPRAGIGSSSYDKAVSVWCADDRHKAMDEAKSGKELTTISCENPVKTHYEIGGKMGVRGTPALFLDNGQMLPGYVPPKRLLQILDEQAKLAQF